jgi:hypothetical protein
MNQERIFIVKIPNCPDTIKPEHIKAILSSIDCIVEEAIQIPLEIGDLVVKTP